MPLRHYGVLRGRLQQARADRDPHSPHFHLLVEAGTRFHVAVNVWSSLDESPLIYRIEQDISHPITRRWRDLETGFTQLKHTDRGGGLDYVRGGLVERGAFDVARARRHGGGALGGLIERFTEQAIDQADAELFAFGTRWGPNSRATDTTFEGFPIHPDDGLHDVHMNQGNRDRPGRADDHLVRDNGPWQDGGLIFHFPAEQRWSGLFLAFQSQSWRTHDQSGMPLSDETYPRTRSRISIVAALVNPIGPAPEQETVTLASSMDHSFDLMGWAIQNAEGQATRLHGEIGAGEERTFVLDLEAPLSNQGGAIRLINPKGEVVDSVVYSRSDAAREGRVLEF